MEANKTILQMKYARIVAIRNLSEYARHLEGWKDNFAFQGMLHCQLLTLWKIGKIQINLVFRSLIRTFAPNNNCDAVVLTKLMFN